MNKTQVSERAASQLLWAAAFLDAVFVFLLLQFLRPLLVALIDLVIPNMSSMATGFDPAILQALNVLAIAVCFLIMLLLYWFLTELLFRGRTLGRMLLALELRQTTGEPPTALQITKRAARKMSSLGISGCKLFGQDQFEVKNGLVWYSPMVAKNLSAARGLRIEILSGANKGKSHVLERLPNFRKHRGIQIGRDPNWSDVVLDQDERVSNKHAVVRLTPKGWQIMDYGGGKGSSNKTLVNGKILVPGTWYPIQISQKFQVANVGIVIER